LFCIILPENLSKKKYVCHNQEMLRSTLFTKCEQNTNLIYYEEKQTKSYEIGVIVSAAAVVVVYVICF
jgi:hypothetical protein